MPNSGPEGREGREGRESIGYRDVRYRYATNVRRLAVRRDHLPSFRKHNERDVDGESEQPSAGFHGRRGEGRGATFDEGSFRVPAFICEESEENLGHYFRIARSEARHPSLSLSLSTMLSDLVPGLEEKFNFTSGRGVEDAAGS